MIDTFFDTKLWAKVRSRKNWIKMELTTDYPADRSWHRDEFRNMDAQKPRRKKCTATSDK